MNEQHLPPLPDPRTLSVDELRLVRDLFSDNAVRAARDGDMIIANWARVITDRYAIEMTLRRRSARLPDLPGASSPDDE